MLEDILTTMLRLASEAGLGLLPTLGVLLAGAVLLVLMRKAGAIKWNPPPVSPDPEQANVSPPVPTANPVTPPDYLP